MSPIRSCDLLCVSGLWMMWVTWH